jgi:glycosyltransferase involved in cell wall biosynthesis
MSMSDITVIVHTRNSERTLPRLLQSLSWAQKVIAVDMFSTDNTRKILKQYGAQIHELAEQPWNDALRNSFLSLPETRWTLVLDSDEYLSEDADQLLSNLIRSAGESDTAFSLPRYNWCFGRVLEGSRWYPDRQIRLFRTGSMTYSSRHHAPPLPIFDESRIVEPNTADAPHIHHEHYSSISTFIESQNRYALTDEYGEDLDWSNYTREVIEGMLEAQHAPTQEERAMELILAWDKLLRALIHWEKRGRVDAIPAYFGWALGVRTMSDHPSSEVEELTGDLRDKLAEAEARVEEMRTTLSWRVTFPLRLLGMFLFRRVTARG